MPFGLNFTPALNLTQGSHGRIQEILEHYQNLIQNPINEAANDINERR